MVDSICSPGTMNQAIVPGRRASRWEAFVIRCETDGVMNFAAVSMRIV